MSTTFRQDFRTGVAGVATAYVTANPGLLTAAYDFPPESYATPMVYLEKKIEERIVHTEGIRFRVLTGQLVIVNKLMSNAQATHEQDVLVDGLMDALTAAPHAASGASLIEPVGVTDTEITAGEGVRYAAAVITVEGSIQEGRS